jgi:hypothetical protein
MEAIYLACASGFYAVAENVSFSTLHGKVHGRNIELDQDPGMADGQEVEVQMKLVQPTRRWGEGILRTAGALADAPDWDAIMEEIHKARKIERRPQGKLCP